MGPLISGTTSVLDGTDVWTDYAYDDRGADPSQPGAYPASLPRGNAADLVQLQLRPQDHDVAVRAVLETLTDRRVPSVGVGLDLDGSAATGAPGIPGGRWTVSGGRLGLERFIVVTSAGADVLSWNGRRWARTGHQDAVVDVRTNTMSATVPFSDLGPAGRSWRVVGVAGLATAGASWVDGSGPISDLAYVRDEGRTNFQSGAQAAVLAGKADVRSAVHTLDVDAVRSRRRLALPTPGRTNTFLYRSRLDLGEGIAPDPLGLSNAKYAGPYQPYAVWFPDDLPARPPLVVFLHGALQDHLSGSYGGQDEFAPGLKQLGLATGELDLPAVIVTPLGRAEAPIGGYDGAGEQDLLDVTADAAHRFGVDPGRMVLTGYSLGGVGTYRLAQLHPDLWAGAVEIVGADDLGALNALDEIGGVQRLPNQLENLRNLPFRMAHARADELELIVGGVQPDRAALTLQALGYDFRYWQFLRREHLSFPVNLVQCEIEQAIARGRVRDPARVTFSQEPALEISDPATGLELHHDGAYWLSDLVVDGAKAEPLVKGTADVTSLARADRTPALTPVLGIGENLTAARDVCGNNPDARTADVWIASGQAWSRGRSQPTSNGLEATLTRVSAVQLDAARMSLDVTKPLKIGATADRPSRIVLRGPWDGAVAVERPGQRPSIECVHEGTVSVLVAKGRTTTWIRPAGPNAVCS